MRPLLAALLLVSLAACDDEPTDPVQAEVVPEADVERFRTEIFRQTLGIDADLAALETDAAAADSVARLAYEPVLDRLRDDRRRLQIRLDTLRPVPRARFDSLSAAISDHAARLRRAVERGPFDTAGDLETFRPRAAQALADVDARLAALAPAVAADTTGRVGRRVQVVAAQRAQVTTRIAAYPDTSDAQFVAFREGVVDALVRLDSLATVVAADTLRTTPAASAER